MKVKVNVKVSTLVIALLTCLNESDSRPVALKARYTVTLATKLNSTRSVHVYWRQSPKDVRPLGDKVDRIGMPGGWRHSQERHHFHHVWRTPIYELLLGGAIC